MDTKTTRLLAKIRKMMEMANRAEGNEAEAAVAAGMVEKLLRKHNLTIADITPEQAKNDTTKDLYRKMKWTAGKCPVWVNRLAITLATTYETFCVFSAAESNDSHVAKAQQHISFVGASLDVAVTVQMFEYLFTTVNRLTDEHFAKNPTPQGKARTYKAAYRDGMATRLAMRLKEMAAERDAEVAVTGTGLMVVKKNAIDEYLGGSATYNMRKRKPSKNDEAFNAGYTKAGSVSMTKQLG